MVSEWSTEWDDEAKYENSGNGYFYQWIELWNESFIDLFDEYLGVNVSSGKVPVRICEPLLYKEIGEVVAHAKRRGKWIKTYTNASLLTEDVGGALLEAGWCGR